MNEEIEKSLLQQKINFFSSEVEKMDQIFSDFTARTNVLFTVAGLLSLLPAVKGVDASYLDYFLIWSFPFLLASLWTYYRSSLRIQPIIKGMIFAAGGLAAELSNSRNLEAYWSLIWQKYSDHYETVLFWNRITTALIYGYIISLSSNFYFFVFFGSPHVCTALTLLSLTVIAVIMLILLPILKSEKNISVGHTMVNTNVGGPPTGF